MNCTIVLVHLATTIIHRNANPMPTPNMMSVISVNSLRKIHRTFANPVKYFLIWASPRSSRSRQNLPTMPLPNKQRVKSMPMSLVKNLIWSHLPKLSDTIRLLRQLLFKLKTALSPTIVPSPSRNKLYAASKPMRLSLNRI